MSSVTEKATAPRRSVVSRCSDMPAGTFRVKLSVLLTGCGSRKSASTAAQTLCASLTTSKEKYDTICKYVTTQFGFDYIAAVTNKPGQLPNVEKCFSRRMGVCQDLSAVTVSMLRVAGVPAKLVIGYADENYHAWVTAEVDGEEVLFDPTAELQGISRPRNYTVERFY